MANLPDSDKEVLDDAFERVLRQAGVKEHVFTWKLSDLIDQGTDTSPTFGTLTATALVSALLSTTTSNTPLVLKGNASDGASAVGVKIGNLVTLANASAKPVAFYKDNVTSEIGSFDPSGNLSILGGFVSDYVVAKTAATPLTIKGKAADGAASVGVKIGQLNALTDEDATLVRIYSDDLSTEAMSVKVGGRIVLPTGQDLTGTPTVNKPTGTVQIALGASTVTVNNTLVNTASLIFCQVVSNDATLKSVSIVAGTNSFVITGNAAATADTKINFWVIN